MIDILMATYNGAEFIENQILSLLSQTFKDWKLIIHDDGSTDQTLTIVRKYLAFDSRITLIEDGITFGNAGMNFMHLLKNSTAEYIIFCDQDDIWFESKLSMLFDKLQLESAPAAVYCNAYAYDGYKITNKQVSLIERNELSNSLFLNSGVQGCSLMFNRKLLSIALQFPKYVYMHDHYITTLAVTFGKLIYIDESLMLYRQHTNNVTGGVPISIKHRLKTLFDKKNSILDRKHYNANVSFFETFKNNMTIDQKEIFNVYINFPKNGFIHKIFNIVKYNFRIGGSKGILILKLFIKKSIN